MVVEFSDVQRLRQTFGWADFPRPLFYQSKFALRLELGGDYEIGPVRFLRAMDRARTVTSKFFSDTKSLTVAVAYTRRRVSDRIPTSMLKTLSSIGFSGTIGAASRMAPRDQDEVETEADGLHRFLCALEISNQADQVSPFIWAAVANEMPISPRFPSLAKNYIIDFQRGLILHVYDDRGMDLSAKSPELLRPVYEQFDEWLLDHARVRMAKCLFDAPRNGE